VAFAHAEWRALDRLGERDPETLCVVAALLRRANEVGGRARGQNPVTPDSVVTPDSGTQDSGTQDTGTQDIGIRHQGPRIRALLIPAAVDRPCEVITVPLTSKDFSEVLGGCLLDDVFYGTYGAFGYCIYADAMRSNKDLPANDRASVLAVRLGLEDHLRRWDLSGDVLVTGANAYGDDQDVPAAVVAAAR
jgi:hypothetical protein